MDNEIAERTVPTISSVCFDENFMVERAIGEFAKLSSVSSGSSTKMRVLSEYLLQFESINRGSLNPDPESVELLIERWANTDAAALEARLADGGWRLLTSQIDVDNRTQFLSVRIDEQKASESLASFISENHILPIWANETGTGRVVFSNQAANKVYGNGPMTHEDQKISDFMGGPAISRKMYAELVDKGVIDNHDVQTKNEAGDEIFVRGCAVLTKYNGTEIVISSIQDFTDRKLIEDEGRKGRDVLRGAIESLSEGFALYDEDHRLVMYNERYGEMNKLVSDLLQPGLEYKTMLREMARRGGYSDAIGREDQWVKERIENAMGYAKNDEVNHSDGKSYQVSIHPTRLGGFVVTRTDITERKQIEAQRREGDLLVRTVLDASSAIVVMAKAGDGEILYRSPAAFEFFGETISAMEHYRSPEDRADLMSRLLSDGYIDDYKIDVSPKGHSTPVSVSSRFAEYKGEEVVVSSIVDLTEQVKAEALIRQVLEACPVPVQMTNAETGELLFRSPETLALFGSAEHARSYYVDPDERLRYLKQLRAKGWVNEYKAEFLNADGKPFWGAVSARLIKFQGEEVIVSNTRDLTDELALQEEFSKQQDLLIQNEKMSAMGGLLAGVAHELNNPLSVVVGHSLMLREEDHEAETLRRIEKISKAAERSAKIVKTFLAMARQHPTKKERMDIGSAVAAAADVANYSQRNLPARIIINLPDDIPDIHADPDQITQVMINLIINAGHAIRDSGVGDEISVSASVAESGTEVEIIVSDNGPGIPADISGRVFEPFFTTKEVGEGTGIGLALCHRIINSHEGEIWLDSDKIRGSRFCIRLPVMGSDPDPDFNNDHGSPAATPRVALVIDDEVDVADFIAEVLSKDGIEVQTANSGSDAILLLQEGSYDFVLSDLNMPGTDGRAVFDTLKSNYPHLVSRIGFITGDTLGEASQKFLQESQSPFLEKPVSPSDLRMLVKRVLGEDET